MNSHFRKDGRPPSILSCYYRHAVIAGISHSREEETPEAKARWFQSLTVEERIAMLCAWTDLVFENNPDIARCKDAKPIAGRVRVLELPRS